jgi:Rrf2 family protein
MNIKRVRLGRQKKGLLHLSSKADYGFLLLMRLAQGGKIARSLRVIAVQDGLSFFFLQRVAADLRLAGLISSGRGKTGGYSLSKPAGKITLKEIIEALDGPLAIMGCVGEGAKACARRDSCMVRPGFEIINRTIIEALSSKTLYDLIKSYGRPGNKKPAR